MDRKRDISSARIDSAQGVKVGAKVGEASSKKPPLGKPADEDETKDDKGPLKKQRTRGGLEKTLAQQYDCDNLHYDKIRWPMYKDMVFRRAKHLPYLPINPKGVCKMVGLRSAGDWAPTSGPGEGQGTQADQMDLTAEPTSGYISPHQDVIAFDGNFECANIEQVRRRDQYVYDIWMRNDSNGMGLLQWFYFRMKNLNNFNGTVKLNIVNFTKANSLFQHGMKPSFWSQIGSKEKEHDNEGWFQECANISYEVSQYNKEINELNPAKTRTYYTLSFDYRFGHMKDTVYCAYTIPYTYTSMLTHIKQLKLLAKKSPYEFIRFDSAGSSIGGLDIPILKITNRQAGDATQEKPIIVIIGRQHTGETHSSFILHGFVNNLLSRSLLTHKFRETHEIWVLPIVNPDGVVIGNYRSSLQGKDMNRHFFTDEDPEAHKNRSHEVEVLRSMLREQFPRDSTRFKVFLDVHAHSAATSIFTYAPMPENPEKDLAHVKRFPALLDSSSAYFLLQNCKWANEKGKKNCARLNIFRDFNVLDSYTIEASCWGYELKGTGNDEEDPEVEQFTGSYFLNFGEHLLQCLCAHLQVKVTDYDRAGMYVGFDIQTDFCLGMHDPTLDKLVGLKKGGKPALKKGDNRADSVSKQSTNANDENEEGDSNMGGTTQSAMKMPPPSALKQHSRFLVNDKHIQGNDTREKFNGNAKGGKATQENFLNISDAQKNNQNKNIASAGVAKRVTFAQDTIDTPQRKEKEKEKIKSEVVGEGSVLKAEGAPGEGGQSKKQSNIFKATDFEQALLAHYKSSTNAVSPPPVKKKLSKLEGASDPLSMMQEQNLQMMSPQQKSPMPEVITKGRHGGRDRRKGKVVITIKAQQPDGSIIEIDPTQLAQMQAGGNIVGGPGPEGLSNPGQFNTAHAVPGGPQGGETVFRTELKVKNRHRIMENQGAQSNMYTKLIEDMHTQQQKIEMHQMNAKPGRQAKPSKKDAIDAMQMEMLGLAGDKGMNSPNANDMMKGRNIRDQRNSMFSTVDDNNNKNGNLNLPDISGGRGGHNKQSRNAQRVPSSHTADSDNNGLVLPQLGQGRSPAQQFYEGNKRSPKIDQNMHGSNTFGQQRGSVGPQVSMAGSMLAMQQQNMQNMRGDSQNSRNSSRQSIRMNDSFTSNMTNNNKQILNSKQGKVSPLKIHQQQQNIINQNRLINPAPTGNGGDLQGSLQPTRLTSSRGSTNLHQSNNNRPKMSASHERRIEQYAAGMARGSNRGSNSDLGALL